MAGFFGRLDEFAGIQTESIVARVLDRAAFVFLLFMAATAPHSIAASQASWLLGSLFTACRFFLTPRPSLKLTALNVALLALFGWAFISSLFSYEPAISLDKLRSVSLFLVFFFAYLNLRRLRSVYLVSLLIVFSCLINVAWVIGNRVIGRGVEVHGVSTEGPLGKSQIIDDATLVSVEGKRLNAPEELIASIEKNGSVKVLVYEYEAYRNVDISRSDLSDGTSAEERLGISSWTRSYNWRAQGFFGHFTTYAEVLQLIASLLLGLIVGGLVLGTRDRSGETPWVRRLTTPLLLIVALGATLIALLLTVTRASQLAFMVSAFVMIILSGSRKLLFAAGLIAIPVVLGGLIFLQQSRSVGFLDSQDESTRYRLTMWKDGMRLVTDNAHNAIFGIGMDSTKRHWQEWDMFDGGRMPMGHFHSTPMQMLVERGVPGLAIWFAVLILYGWTLWSGLRDERSRMKAGEGDRYRLGVLLGCIGALFGFFVSGLVHYNIGDGEVAMVFYLLMALGVRTAELSNDEPGNAAEGIVEYRAAA